MKKKKVAFWSAAVLMLNSGLAGCSNASESYTVTSSVISESVETTLNETSSDTTTESDTTAVDETTETEAVTEEPTLSEVVSKEGTINGIHYEIGDGEYYNARFDARGYIIDTENRPDAPYYYFISAGTKYSGGYSISVVDVDIDTDKNAYITVSEKSPGPEDIVTEALTYPYCVVIFSELPKSVKIVSDDGYEYKYLDGIADPETSETEEDTSEKETEAEPSTTATKEESHTAPSSLVIDVIDPPTASPSKPVTPSPTAPTTAAVVPVSIEATVNGTHYLGDTLKASDFTIKVTYSDGSVVPNPAGWSASNLSLNSASNGIVISYGGLQTTVSVPASERPTVAPTEAPTVAPTQAPTTAPTTVAPTTVAPTTAAPTTEAPTTVAPTTAAPAESTPANGTYFRTMAEEFFRMQNEDRVAHGAPALIWDEDLYQRSLQASKAVADAMHEYGLEAIVGKIHDYSAPYLVRRVIVDGNDRPGVIVDNLCEPRYTNEHDTTWFGWNAIVDSPLHYDTAMSSSFTHGAVGCCYVDGRVVICSVFWNGTRYPDYY